MDLKHSNLRIERWTLDLGRWTFPLMRASSPPMRAFTLIELLVVISIIAVLMGLAFPAFQAVQTTAKKTQAKNDLVQIVTAVNAFYTEYGRYPTNATNDPGAVILPGANNGSIFNELGAPSGATLSFNTRQIVFLSPPEAKDQVSPKGGVKKSTGEFFDPFGTQYGIAIDADYDNEVSNPYTADTGAGSAKVRQGVISWSFGKDGQTGTDKNSGRAKDDVISWQ